MTAKEFNVKFTDEKLTYLWENGIFVDERISYNKYIIKVYSLHNLWVEVYYGIPDGKIEDIYALDDDVEEDWEGLLNHIDLRDLF